MMSGEHLGGMGVQVKSLQVRLAQIFCTYDKLVGMFSYGSPGMLYGCLAPMCVKSAENDSYVVW